MPNVVASLFALLSGTGIFVAATGLVATTVALRAEALGFEGAVIGFVLSTYSAGFVVGTFVGPAVVERVGHVRAYTAFAGVAGTAVLLHPILTAPAWWALFRFLTGAGVVGMYMVIESWLNERASNDQRGSVFTAYQAISLTSLGLGQFLLLVRPETPAAPFLLTGVLLSLSLLPIALTRVPQPAPVRPARLNLARLWQISPLAMLGTALTAVAGGMLFALGPVYARYLGMTNAQVALFMSLIIFGGALLQWPLGRLSDLIDRRTVIVGVALAGSLLAAVASVLFVRSALSFYATAFCYGGAVFSLYPLCVAHAGDHARPEELVRTASGLLLIYGAGATAGPILGGTLIGAFGAPAFFVTLSAVLGLLTLVALARMLVRSPPPPEAQEPFVPLATTSQTALEMLPDAVQESADEPPDNTPP